MPSAELPPIIPFTSQVTLVWLVPATIAEKSVTPLRGTLTAVGEMVMLIAVLICRVIDANFDGSAAGVAVIVTLFGDGAIGGAA